MIMKLVVLDAATLGDDLDLTPLQRFGEVTVRPNTAPEEVGEAIRDADVVILNKIRLNSSNLAGSRVRLICVAATGYDNIDTGWCGQQGIAVCNVVGYSTDSVVQLTLAMALSLATYLPEYTQYVRDGSYSAGNTANRLSPAYHELAGKTWGIAGYGNIGRKVGMAALALGCRILVYKRTSEPGISCVNLETLCRQSDILSVHLPLNDSTRNLFSADKIALMKPDVLFINVARGAVADEHALAAALQAGKIGGLGIDVYSQEPFPVSHPFFSLREHPRVCMTPHMAWGSVEARIRCLQEIVLNIEAFQQGKLRSCVNQESFSLCL